MSFPNDGGNDNPEKYLHDTNKAGNVLLRDMFHAIHSERHNVIPPIFVFTKCGRRRDVFFEGMALGRAMVGVESGSVYDSGRGLLVINLDLDD